MTFNDYLREHNRKTMVNELCKSLRPEAHHWIEETSKAQMIERKWTIPMVHRLLANNDIMVQVPHLILQLEYHQYKYMPKLMQVYQYSVDPEADALDALVFIFEALDHKCLRALDRV